MLKIIIYGCGTDYQSTKAHIRSLESQGAFSVAGVCAKQLPPADTLDGWPVIRRDQLGQTEYDAIMILSQKYEKEIMRELADEGIERQRILETYAFLHPAITEAARGLRNAKITILSNNCFGGIMASTLGMECCSPFKNLWVEEKQFIRFLEHPGDYLSLEPVPAGWENGKHKTELAHYPVLKLGDIRLHCNHDTDPDEAIAKWKRRAKKINWENMIAVMLTMDAGLEQPFYQAGTVRKKYCLTPFESSNPHTVTVRTVPGLSWVESALLLARPITDFNLIAMCNGEDPCFLECE